LISKEKLIELYSAMVMCRMIAERAGRLAREGNLSSGLDAGLGREATIAGITVDLLPEDTLQATREAFVSSFLKGLPLDQLFAGAVRSSNGHAAAAKPVRGDAAMQEAHLVGACATAKEHKAAKRGKITVAFCDTEQTHPGRWRRSLDVASRHDLPIIFVRHREVSSEENETPRRGGKRKNPEAMEHGVPVIYVDGDDVVAVYRVASESIARARQRRGPTLIDCLGDRGGLNGKTESHGLADPIAIMESHLAGKGLFNRGLRKKITEGFAPELDKATRSLSS
jgi:acetoin:2,6-dichlorophenolindophenol oxidoreductase subunit alpha